MKNIVNPLTSKLLNILKLLVSWLESNDCLENKQSKFVDLAPTDAADKSGIYSEALLFAIHNDKVSNIAVTGPYGSGKSSVIRSFLKKYRCSALQISLATFVPESGTKVGDVSRQEIERSILQQMLYGGDANKLPLSRFKRIKSPGVWSPFKSLYILLGIIALLFVSQQLGDVVSGKFFTPFEFSNWFKLSTFFFSVIFLWVTLHLFYVASFGLSLKSISLKDVEIKPAQDDQASILNLHLDEIIYFFQSTAYELVIIEDLDRFNDAEIFVTLREINCLVNENAGVKRRVKFLYALRDDMFVNIERTKFFEFIIPIIPIINSSNSIDMVLEQGQRLELETRLNRQFLREVSRYLDDMRLIQNIFNEYAIYVSNLENDGESVLNANKLLAILIYKNIYPRDFERLHRGEGALAGILNLKDEIISASEIKYRAEITEIEKQLEVAEHQTPSNLKELRQIYAMALLEKIPTNLNMVGLNHNDLFAVNELANSEAFEQLLNASTIYYRLQNGYHPQSINLPNWQNEVDTQKSYFERKKEIQSKEKNYKNKSLRRINELRAKISSLRTNKLNVMLRLNAERVQSVFETVGINGELARFLIFEGYIDDTYYQYTSLFHAGRLSPNDNKFLIQIRAFVTPEPTFTIDNAKEVIVAMRDEDFRQSFVLNVKLVDCLLSDTDNYSSQTKKLFELLSSEFEQCASFFDAYYANGQHVSGLLTGLSTTWEELIPYVIESPSNISHVTQIVSKLPENTLKTLTKNFEDLPDFIAKNLPEILIKLPELPPERLEWLGFEVKDLKAIKDHSEIARFMFEKGRFKLSIENLEYAFEVILVENDHKQLREKNLTAIRAVNCETLIKRIERDFGLYVRDVLLELEENTKEDVPAILAVINCDSLELGEIREFLNRQTTLFPSLDGVPMRCYSILFQLNKIEATWFNCLTYMESSEFEADILTGYLELKNVRATLLTHPIPDNQDYLTLRSFLLKASSLSDVAYKEYVFALPRVFHEFPKEFEPTKLRILIDAGKISFTSKSLDTLANHRELQLRFVAANIRIYLEKPDNFEINDDFREKLLETEINDAAKIGIIKLMDLETLVGLPKRAGIIGPIINNSTHLVSGIDENIAECLIINSRPIAIQISLFNNFHHLMNDVKVRNVLSKLPAPYSEIRTGYNTPRLQNTLGNKVLVKWLHDKKIISSWSENDTFNNDLKINLYRR
ncbi:YobI family P-loop NTPase [Rheinheimera salexigens]|uniref:DNA-binding protein n=1 Tax=Rheinheimera salexigens TaxID=1628148 RepID=A0A1E7Q3W7_9GAMM|nr:DNA-binding protein [Rheinheimera salexigens]OEY68821.1 DNA-binding protein [Rheinheimera salexigens]